MSSLNNNGCLQCGKPVKKGNKFCCVACSNVYRTRSEESKAELSKKMKRNYSTLFWVPCISEDCSNVTLRSRSRPRFCKHCLQKSLSSRASIGGKISAKTQAEARRSKPEKEFFEIVKQVYADAEANQIVVDGWDADIVIPSIKTTIHWNGRWHYQQITKKHSIAQVQNRDFLKVTTFEKNGWKSIVIRDLQDKKPSQMLEPVLKHIQFGFGTVTLI